MIRVCLHLVAPARRGIEDLGRRSAKRAVVKEVNARFEAKLLPEGASELGHRRSLVAGITENRAVPTRSRRFRRQISLTPCCSASYNLCLFGRGVEQSGSSSGS